MEKRGRLPRFFIVLFSKERSSNPSPDGPSTTAVVADLMSTTIAMTLYSVWCFGFPLPLPSDIHLG